MTLPRAARFRCATCGKRSYWCRTCKTRHCWTCAPHPSRARKYLAKIVQIQKRNGQQPLMSARRYAHLQGASRGGTVTAGRPNPGRFTSETGRKAAKKAWQTRWRAVGRPNYDGPALRIGRPRKYRQAVNRACLRAMYASVPRLGIRYLPVTGQWILEMGTSQRILGEKAALIRLGHLPTYTKNWVPGPDEPVLRTIVGRLPALGRGQGRKHT